MVSGGGMHGRAWAASSPARLQRRGCGVRGRSGEGDASRTIEQALASEASRKAARALAKRGLSAWDV